MKAERQRDDASSKVGQTKLSKFFTSQDDQDIERKIKHKVVVKAETSSKYFAHNASDSLDESISDFKPERPKRIITLPAKDSTNECKSKKPVKTKKSVKKNSTTAPRKKCMKKQQNLLKFTKEFEEVCAIGGVDVNPEHLQLAIALSRSLSDYQDGGNPNQEVTEEVSDPSTGQEFKSEEDMVKRIRKTLDQYGFKVPMGPISLMPKATTKRKRFNKAMATSVLLTRSLQEKKEIISTKVSQILLECQIKDPDEDFDSCTNITDLHSSVLRDIWCKTSPIFTKTKLDYKDMEEFDVFYVKNLITPSDTKAGSLLKDWKTIPGRDSSPERITETVDFRENMLFPDHLDLLLSSTYSYISEKISLLNSKSPKKSRQNSGSIDTPSKPSSDVSPKNTCLDHSKINTPSTHIHNSGDIIEICDGSRSCSPDIFDDDNYYEDEDIDNIILSTKSESSKAIHIEVVNSSGEELPKVSVDRSQKSEIFLSQSGSTENALSQSCNIDGLTPPVILNTSDTDFTEKNNQVIEASIDLTQIMFAPDNSIISNRCSNEFKHAKLNANLNINNPKKDEVVCLIDETVDLDLTNSDSENDNVVSEIQSGMKQCETSHAIVDISDAQIEDQNSENVNNLSNCYAEKNNVSLLINRNKSFVVNKHKRISFNSFDDSVRFDEMLKDFKKNQPNVNIDESIKDTFVKDSIDLTQNDCNPANISRNSNCSQIYESQNGIVHFESYHEDIESLDISIGGSSPKEVQKSLTTKNVSNISTSSDCSKNFSKNESQIGILHFESDHEDVEILNISMSPPREIQKTVEKLNYNDISMSPINHKTQYLNDTVHFEAFSDDVEPFGTSLIRASSSKIARRNINNISFSSQESYKNESQNGIIHFESYYEPLEISCNSKEIDKSKRRNVNEISFSSPERSRNSSKEKDIFGGSAVLDSDKSYCFSLDDQEHVTVDKENIDLTQSSNDSANSHSRDIIINQSECNKKKSINESSMLIKSPNFKCNKSELFDDDKSFDKIPKDSTDENSAGNDIFILSDEEFNYSISTPYRTKSPHHSRSRIQNKTNCNDKSLSDDNSSSISDKVNKSRPHSNKSTTSRLSTKSKSLHSIKSTTRRLSTKSSSFHINEPSDISKCINDEDCNQLGVPYRFSNQFDLYGSSIFDQIPSYNSCSANSTNCERISDTSKRKTVNPNKETSPARDNDSIESESLPNVYLNRDKQTNNRLTIQIVEIDELLRRNKMLVDDLPLVKSPSRKDTPEINKYIIKTDNVTPAQNYSAMDTPKIHKELSKFGLKPLKRKRGKLL